MIDFGDDETFIDNYKKLKSSRKMGELYGCDKKSITTHAKKIGYDYSSNKEIKITASPEELYQLYLKLGSTQKLQSFLIVLMWQQEINCGKMDISCKISKLN